VQEQQTGSASLAKPRRRIALRVAQVVLILLFLIAALLGTFTGVGPFKHDDPRDRPASVFGGDVTLHAGPGQNAYVMLPVIPEE